MIRAHTIDELGAMASARRHLDSLPLALRAEVLGDLDIERAAVAELLASIEQAKPADNGAVVTLSLADWRRIVMAHHNARVPQ